MPQRILFIGIASGSQVSNDCDLSQAGRGLWAIMIPNIVSGDLLVHGALDTSTFRRLLDTRAPGSGDLRFATGPGSRMVMWPPDFSTPPYIRLETAAVQSGSNVTTFTLLMR
jgi:hypothetical protein